MKPILKKISPDNIIKLSRHLEKKLLIPSPPILRRQSNRYSVIFPNNSIYVNISGNNSPMRSGNNSPMRSGNNSPIRSGNNSPIITRVNSPEVTLVEYLYINYPLNPK